MKKLRWYKQIEGQQKGNRRKYRKISVRKNRRKTQENKVSKSKSNLKATKETLQKNQKTDPESLLKRH